MGRMVSFMCDLVIHPMSTALKPVSRLILQNSLDSGIGKLLMAGINHRSVGLRGRPHMRILGCHAAVYTLAGACLYRDASGRRAELRAGDLMLLDPRLPHHYESAPGTRWDQLWVTFEGPVFDLWHAQGRLGPAVPVARLEPVAFWQRRLEDLCALPSAPTPPDILQQVSRWQQLLAEAWAASSRDARAPERAWVQRALAAVEATPGTKLNGPATAHALGMSYEHFRKRFRALVGRAPAQHRNRKRMEAAARQLLTTSAPLKGIAAALGFCDEFDFSRRFKRVMGVPPSTYRRQMPRG